MVKVDNAAVCLFTPAQSVLLTTEGWGESEWGVRTNRKSEGSETS